VTNDFEMERYLEELAILKEELRLLPKGRARRGVSKKISDLRADLNFRFITRERGMSTESRVFHVILKKKLDWPHWLMKVEQADTHLDEVEGVDILVTTTRGTIAFNVKSSDVYIENHYDKHPKIPVLVIFPDNPDSLIYGRFIRLLKKEMINNRFFTTTTSASR